MYTGSRSYFSSTKKFYYSLFFILPFLTAYEIGLFQGVLGGNIIGADAILRFFFYFLYTIIGVAVTRVISAVVIVALGAYLIQYLVKNRIRIRPLFLILMLLESLSLAFFAGVIIHLILNQTLPKFFTFMPNLGVVRQLAISDLNDFWSKIVASIGAGVFEEFIFRVILLRVFYGFWKNGYSRTFGSDTGALARSIGLSSFIFTIMHIGSVGSIFGLVSIFFGSFIFSLLYIKRGYGIVAGTHIFYDMYLMFGILA